MKKFISTLALMGVFLFLKAQVTQPPSGDNQKSVVVQYMGLVSVKVVYNSPDVDGRAGKIWGQLVPYGLTNEGFGYSTEANPTPWRAGANENTTITLSHDVQVEGKSLPAGTYGLHTIPGEKQWEVIFSKNADAWGSYFYEKKDDALRVTVTPVQAEYNEWLTYEFDNRKQDACTLWLKWENLGVPIKFSSPNNDQLYVDQMRKELQGFTGFESKPWTDAVNFCVSKKINLDEALRWADYAISAPFAGARNFNTLQAKAGVLAALNKNAEADALLQEAIKMPDATVNQIHTYARQLLAQKEPQKALEIFKFNAERFPGQFTTLVGLARGYSATGDYKTALKYAKEALPLAPNDLNKNGVGDMIKKLGEGKDVN